MTAEAVRGYADALAHLQSLLGGLNDAATVERLCEQLRPRPDDPDGTLLEAIGLVRGWAVAAPARISRRCPPPGRHSGT